MNTYDVIKALCDEKGIAVTALEKELGFGRGSIGKLKKGGSPSTQRLQKIADYFGVNLQYFADRVEPVKIQAISLFSGAIAKDTKDTFVEAVTKALQEMFSEDEYELIAFYRKLNEDGKNKLTDYLLDLMDMPKYTAPDDAQGKLSDSESA